jgi:hypothetical protein
MTAKSIIHPLTSQERPEAATPQATTAELHALLQQSLTMWEYIFTRQAADAAHSGQTARASSPDETTRQS